MKKKRRVVTAIDIGTTKVCTVIALVGPDEIEVLGTGWCPSAGLKKGIIVNLNDSLECIKSSLDKAEEEAGTVASSAFVNLGGAYLRGVNASGSVAIDDGDEVAFSHLEQAIEAARRADLPQDSMLIHVLRQSFSVDGQAGILDPIGLKGETLTASVYLTLASSVVVNNIVNAVNKAGVVVDAVVMQQLASAEAVLSSDEKELGAIVVDIGGGTTDISVYRHGSICHVESVPIGGDLVSQDIAVGLKTSLKAAEDLKRNQAAVWLDDVENEEMIEVAHLGDGDRRRVPRRLLCAIARARCDEILESVARVSQRSEVEAETVTGVVLTGGGSLLQGLKRRAEGQLGHPIRRGLPTEISAREVAHPAYCTVLGLIRYAQRIRHQPPSKGPLGWLASGEAGPPPAKKWLMERIG